MQITSGNQIGLLLTVLFLAGCRTADLGSERTEAALLFENGLAYDGCAAHIQLLSDSLFYGPTTSSRPVLQKALEDIPRDSTGFARAVTVRFVRTGKQTRLPCGWGGSKQAGELDMLEITKR